IEYRRSAAAHATSSRVRAAGVQRNRQPVRFSSTSPAGCRIVLPSRIQEAHFMAKRMGLMLAGVAIVLALLGTIKFIQIRAAIAQGSSFQPPPEAVTTIVVREQDWPATLSAIGTVAAVHGVVVSADLPGVVRKIEFDSGRPVHA